MCKYYAGIGSRDTPTEVQEVMYLFAIIAASKNFILRSGAAKGADKAFEDGVDYYETVICGGSFLKNKKLKEIFLPWEGYNKSKSTHFKISDTAHAIAAEIHPGYNFMKQSSRNFIARNMMQILGQNFNTPVEFVVCWTKDGCEHHATYTPNKTGGTGSAIALASLFDIPVYNLYNKDRLEHALKHLLKD